MKSLHLELKNTVDRFSKKTAFAGLNIRKVRKLFRLKNKFVFSASNKAMMKIKLKYSQASMPY